MKISDLLGSRGIFFYLAGKNWGTFGDHFYKIWLNYRLIFNHYHTVLFTTKVNDIHNRFGCTTRSGCTRLQRLRCWCS